MTDQKKQILLTGSAAHRRVVVYGRSEKLGWRNGREAAREWLMQNWPRENKMRVGKGYGLVEFSGRSTGLCGITSERYEV